LVTTLRTLDSPLQGHPDRSRLGLVAVSTGALGQGLSVALGRAEARRLRGQDSTVYCLRTALAAARRTRDRPSVVLARTVKGRLGPGRVLLNGAHSGVLSAEEFNVATAHLREAP
jgi:transketolase N-terminal domain/subunit